MASGNGFRPCDFILQFLRGRWFMMFASFLVMTSAGGTYLFGTYSQVIKSTLAYDQSTLNLIGSCKDLGANIGVLSGLLAEVAPFWFVLLVGSVLNFVGYFLVWLAVTKKIPTPKVWQMCLYIYIGANSQNFANTGALVPCVRNFPRLRGVMIGVLKGYTGLSGAVFTQLYLAIYGVDSKSLILLIGWLPAVISLMFIFVIRVMELSPHPNETKVLNENLVISVVLALVLMGLTISQKFIKYSSSGYVAGATGVCILLFLPCLIAIREEWATWRNRKENLSRPPESVVIQEPKPEPESEKPQVNGSGAESEKRDQQAQPNCLSNVCNKPKRGEDYSILQALLSIDMLLIFIIAFCGLGCSLSAIDNLGQIGIALGYPTQTTSAFVSLVSIWNYFGRVSSGFVSEKLISKWKVPRTAMFTFALVLPAIADLIIALPFPGSVYVASIMVGFSFGTQLAMIFVIVSELFGLKHYSTLFNCGQLAGPIGSYVINVRIVGKLYDKEALKQLASKGMTRSMVRDLTCIGKQCYRPSFLILAGLNGFAALVSLLLVARTRAYYGSDIYKKFRDEMDGNDEQ